MPSVVASKSSLEAARIENLKKYEILDTPPDGNFDRLTKLAAQMLDMPIAIVSLVDKDRIWFKSNFGIDVKEISRDPGLCSSAILSNDLYLVSDARKNPETLANPLVAGEFGLRFYAAMPLETKEGYNLGTFCVIDKKPRHFTKGKRDILRLMARLVMDLVELRLEARLALKHQHDLLNITAHELKNPIAMMPLLSEMIVQQKNNPEAIVDIANQIKQAGKRMNSTVDHLLENARADQKNLQLRLHKIDLGNLTKGIVETNDAFARKKNQELIFNIENTCSVYADERRLTEVIDNIISNAIKFTPLSGRIEVALKKVRNKARITVKDNGPGLTAEDKKMIFQRYTSLSAQPTGGEESTGLGLSIAKDLITAHKGKITAFSEGSGKGAVFTVELPLSK